VGAASDFGQGPHERRQLLIDAFTKVAAERGYEQVTIDEVVATAGLSRASFFEYFDSKRQCLAASYDAFFDRLTAQARVACAAEETWPAGVRAAVIASLEFLLETASRARLFMVEAVAGGLPLFERRLALTERLAKMLGGGRQRIPDTTELPASTEWILVGGVLARVSEHLLEEEPDALAELEAEVVELVLTPFVGVGEARRVAES
jgi:AcrR family transcriptional regulator